MLSSCHAFRDKKGDGDGEEARLGMLKTALNAGHLLRDLLVDLTGARGEGGAVAFGLLTLLWGKTGERQLHRPFWLLQLALNAFLQLGQDGADVALLFSGAVRQRAAQADGAFAHLLFQRLEQRLSMLLPYTPQL